LKYIDKTWCQPEQNSARRAIDVIVTENGYAGQDEGELGLSDIVNDTHRQDYYTGYIESLVQAVNEGVSVRGYLAWSLLE
jgi:beta-glucosidase/6-phospho-beta-glucosidase/beta-galactosidase